MALCPLLFRLTCVSIRFFTQSTPHHWLKARNLWVCPALPQMAAPLPGDRILVLRPHWLNLILEGEKTLEIRGRNLSAGKYWLGTRGMIHGLAILEPAILINTLQAWQDLRHRHCVDSNELPYKTTYGLPIRQCLRVMPTPYEHPRGAVGIVKYR